MAEENKSLWDRITDTAGDGLVGIVGNIFTPGLPGTQQTAVTAAPEKSGLAAVPTWAWVVGGVAITGLVVFLVTRKN